MVRHLKIFIDASMFIFNVCLFVCDIENIENWFVNYFFKRLTTLPDAADRLLATSVTAKYEFNGAVGQYILLTSASTN